jgi:hypothetical protein
VFLLLKPLQESCVRWDSHDFGGIALTAAYKISTSYVPEPWAFVVLFVTICIWRLLFPGHFEHL